MRAAAPNIRVLLVDDHKVVRAGLRMLINSRPQIKVVAEAANREEALAQIIEAQPDIVLLDLDLGPDKGLDFLPELLERADHARVVLLTALHDEELHRRGIQLGAMGVVLKDHSPEVVIKAIEKVHAGEVWIERSMMASVLHDARTQSLAAGNNDDTLRIATLTAREREIIRLIGAGMKNPQIAEQLNLSEATVRNHMTAIFSKLEVADRFELVIYAYRHHLAELPV